MTKKLDTNFIVVRFPDDYEGDRGQVDGLWMRKPPPWADQLPIIPALAGEESLVFEATDTYETRDDDGEHAEVYLLRGSPKPKAQRWGEQQLLDPEVLERARVGAGEVLALTYRQMRRDLDRAVGDRKITVPPRLLLILELEAEEPQKELVDGGAAANQG